MLFKIQIQVNLHDLDVNLLETELAFLWFDLEVFDDGNCLSCVEVFFIWLYRGHSDNCEVLKESE